jgi:predicted esterase
MSIACRTVLSVMMMIAILGPANPVTIHDAAAKTLAAPRDPAKDRPSQAASQDDRLGDTIRVIGPRVNRCRVRLPASRTPGKAYPLVIGLHGNGGNPDDIMRGLAPEAFPGMICAAPEGPYPREDMSGQPGGHYGWFVLTPDKKLWRTLDAATSDYILAVIDEVAKGCPVSKVVLLGFSQGVSAAYLAALRRPERIAGVVAFAGSFPEEELTADEIKAGSHIKVLIGHGTADKNVNVAESERARDRLRGAGYQVQFHTFDGGHEVPSALLRLAGEWIRGLLPDRHDLDVVHEGGIGGDHDPLLTRLLPRVEPAAAVSTRALGDQRAPLAGRHGGQRFVERRRHPRLPEHVLEFFGDRLRHRPALVGRTGHRAALQRPGGVANGQHPAGSCRSAGPFPRHHR